MGSGESKLSGEFLTRSPEETFELGRRLGQSQSGGALILLSGELGAGKTVLIKGLAAGLGIDPDDVCSPSFTIINIYEGRLRLYHVDLYRLDAVSRPDLGLDEILQEENAVVAVEWGERLDRPPAGAIRIVIEYASDTERRINISQPDAS